MWFSQTAVVLCSQLAEACFGAQVQTLSQAYLKQF